MTKDDDMTRVIDLAMVREARVRLRALVEAYPRLRGELDRASQAVSALVCEEEREDGDE